MTTALEITSAALEEAGILAAGETASSEDGATALNQLNRMLSAWEFDGIKLNHTTLAAGDTIPYPDSHEEAFIFNLALRLCGVFTTDPKATTAAGAEKGYRNLQNFYADPPSMNMDSMLNPYYEPNRLRRF